jgi:hypothetical protein
MQHAFNELLHFLQEGISAIFRFVQLIWTWSVDQISTLLAVPWHQWPLWKQILLVLVLVGVVWALYTAARELFRAGERIPPTAQSNYCRGRSWPHPTTAFRSPRRRHGAGRAIDPGG